MNIYDASFVGYLVGTAVFAWLAYSKHPFAESTRYNVWRDYCASF